MMKKGIGFLLMTLVLFSMATVFAGSVPEDLLYEDDAQVFFAEIVEYNHNAGNPQQKVKTATVLSELFGFEKEEIENIEVIYPGDGDPYGCYVDKDEFFAIAETITLIPKRRIDPIENNQAVWIVAVDKNDNRIGVLLDHRARVGCPQYEASSAVTTQYDISKKDYLKLYAFLPEEATAHIPLENPMKHTTFLFVAGALLVFALAFAVGFFIKKARR